MKQIIFKDDITQENKDKIIEYFCHYRSSLSKFEEYETLKKILNEKELEKFLNKTYDELVTQSGFEKNDYFSDFITSTDLKTYVDNRLFVFLSYTMHFVREGTNIIDAFEINKDICSKLYFDASLNRCYNHSEHDKNILIKAGYKPTEKDIKNIEEFRKFRAEAHIKNIQRKFNISEKTKTEITK